VPDYRRVGDCAKASVVRLDAPYLPHCHIDNPYRSEPEPAEDMVDQRSVGS